jgi:hypothetical protein
LKYAREHGCPWNEVTCESAARNGHLECLKYARERGCPWDEKTYIHAVLNGDIEAILFLIEREHPHAQSLRRTWDEVAMPIFPDVDAVIGLEIALSRHRHRHDADGGHVSLREILPFWREHRRAYHEAHRAARVHALLPEIDKERRRVARS